MAANLLFRTKANSSPVTSSAHVSFLPNESRYDESRREFNLAVFALEWRFMFFLRANLPCTEHDDRALKTPSMAAWKVRQVEEEVQYM
jgi:hypothetical protein